MAKLVDGVKAVQKMIGGLNGFNRVLKRVRIVSAGDGRCRAEMLLTAEDHNALGMLHTGLTTTLVDVISSFAVMEQRAGAWGVSVDIHIQCLKAAKEGDEIVIDASTLKLGQRLAFLEVDISNKLSGDRIAKGTHTIFLQ